jgi:hypothetical protein
MTNAPDFIEGTTTMQWAFCRRSWGMSRSGVWLRLLTASVAAARRSGVLAAATLGINCTATAALAAINRVRIGNMRLPHNS